MATIKVPCRFCGGTDEVRRHGNGSNGNQRFRCSDCKRTFQVDYAYEACKPGMKDKIIDMAMNNAGVRDTARVLKVGCNTVLRTLKNSRQGK